MTDLYTYVLVRDAELSRSRASLRLLREDCGGAVDLGPLEEGILSLEEELSALREVAAIFRNEVELGRDAWGRPNVTQGRRARHGPLPGSGSPPGA